MIISASTSGGLARKLVKERQTHPDRIIHLLGVASENSKLRERCIYFRVSEPHRKESSGGSAIIDISTEEFIVAQGAPRPVRITRHLVNRRGATELRKKFYFDAMAFYGPRPAVRTAYSTFSLAGDAASYSSSPIRAWIKDTLVHELPASIRMLVCLDDPMSARVAESIQQALGANIRRHTLGELSSLEPSLVGATVVVAYQDPDLEGLRRANITLRNWGDTHRHYLVCYAFPSSGHEHARLKSDLQMRAGGTRFGWSEFLVMPVGASSLHESFRAERSAFSKEALAECGDAIGKELATALGARGSRPLEISSDGLFLPRICGRPLKLRRGSIFFGEQAGDIAVSQICVYAMVTAALQKAREEKFGYGGADWSGFDDNPFVRSVLDPSLTYPLVFTV